jgi:hypothetical protein
MGNPGWKVVRVLRLKIEVYGGGGSMAYAEQGSVAPGLPFRTPSGLVVKTTGKSLRVTSHNLYVHEVEIVQGPGEGNKFYLHLDHAQPA